jgi:hypothetical protein
MPDFAKVQELADGPASRRFFGKRIKFIWGASRVVDGRWYLGLVGFYDRADGFRNDGLAFSVRGLLLWGLGCAVALYGSGAYAIYAIAKRSPYNLTTYADVLRAPFQPARFRERSGRALIAEGHAAWVAGQYAKGRFLLEAGLSRAPAEYRTREELAQIYALIHQRARALTTLTAPLAAKYPGRPYLESLFSFAAEGEDFSVTVEACTRFLTDDTGTVPAADRRWLDRQRLVALLGARRTEEALQIAHSLEVAAPTLAAELETQALLELGRPLDALVALANWQTCAAPEDRSPILRLQARAFRESHRLAEMTQTLDSFRSLNSTDPTAALYGVVQRILAGQDEAARSAFDRYFLLFGHKRDDLLLAAKALSETGATPFVQRCLAAAEDQGFNRKLLYVELFRSQLRQGDWPAAARTLDVLHPLIVPDNPQEQLWFAWKTHLLAATASTGPLAVEAFVQFVERYPLASLSFYRENIETLLHAGCGATARRVLEKGTAAYPASVTLAALQAELDRLNAQPASDSAEAPEPTPPS